MIKNQSRQILSQQLTCVAKRTISSNLKLSFYNSNRKKIVLSHEYKLKYVSETHGDIFKNGHL